VVLKTCSDVATPTVNVIPHHYIFLVDVSYSMNDKLGEKTLLERVKVKIFLFVIHKLTFLIS